LQNELDKELLKTITKKKKDTVKVRWDLAICDGSCIMRPYILTHSNICIPTTAMAYVHDKVEFFYVPHL